MPDLVARDGTRLAYHVVGDGRPVICLAGGPMLDSAYLGDLGGLSRRRQLVLVDYRGTGSSQTPRDLTSCRCDRLTDDVEALRDHLGLDRVDLLAHSAGANVAAAYATRRPERVGKVVMVTPSVIGVGITPTSETRREVVLRREAEPWFGPAREAFEAVTAGRATPEDWLGIAPLTYGRWDGAARAHHSDMEQRRRPQVAAAFGADGAFDPEATRAGLAAFDGPVLVLAGAVDVSAPPAVVAEFAALWRDATLVTQEGAGHFPWLDDPARFTKVVGSYLG
ncbi:alpha/beta fold hydrolase [Saccharothrix hoggarensis]|uniref:Alpha/beta fold hydrolase n=1 Tax=Saccharothrix hoggarensis TaxID=913853 RepID=A0ABW3R430_9PSEU